MRNDIHVWDISDSRKVRTLSLGKHLPSDNIAILVMNADGRTLCCSSRGGAVHFIDMQRVINPAFSDADCVVGSVKTKKTSIISLKAFEDSTLIATSVNLADE